MADLATLTVKVDAKDAVAQTKSLGKAMDQTGVSAEVLQKRAESLARMQARLAATAGQQRASLATLVPIQAQVARGFTANAAATARMTTVLGTLGGQSRSVSTVVSGLARVASVGFGPGGLATLAFASFGSVVVRELFKARTAMDETRDKFRETLRDMINEGATFKMKAQAQDLFLGTPAEGFNDGIVARRRRIRGLEGALAATDRRINETSPFNIQRLAELDTQRRAQAAALKAENDALTPLVDKYEALVKAILDVQNVPWSRSGPLPIVTNASRLADELTRAATAYERIAAAAGFAGRNLSTRQVDSRGRPIGLDASIPFVPGTPYLGGVPGGRSLIAPQGPDDRAAAEAARNFRENVQRAGADFIATFLTDGRSAIRQLFSGLQGIGSNIIGNAVSSRITANLPSSFGGQLAAGAAAFGIGTVISSIFSLGDASRAAARAMLDAERSIRDYGRFGREAGLSDEQRRLNDERAARDREALGAVRATNLPGFSGSTFEEALEFARGWSSMPLTYRARGRELLEMLEELGEAFELNTQVLQRQVAQQRIASLQNTVNTLRDFRSDLIRSDLSIYNPFQQRDEARRVYEDILARARGGDQTAAGQLPAAARAFLEQSRGINASGARYVADFQRVERDTREVEALFVGRISIEEEMLKKTTQIGDNIAQIDRTLERTEPWLQASVTVAQQGFTALIAEVRGLREENVEQSRELFLLREELSIIARRAA